MSETFELENGIWVASGFKSEYPDHPGVHYGSRVELQFNPETGIMNASGGHDHHGEASISLDLSAEFWKMTRRDARKNPPAEFTYVLAGSINPHFIAMLTYGRWLTQGGTVVNRLHVHHWWPLPAWVGAIKEEE